jgi:hypothetical protein
VAPRQEKSDGDNLPLKVLLEEYKHLSTTVEKIGSIPFGVLTLVVAIAVAVAAFQPAHTSLHEIVAAYAIAAMVGWLAFLHSMAAGFCLRLVRIELLIYRASKAREDEFVCWYSLSAGSSARHFPGYCLATLCVTLLGGTVLAMSLFGGCEALQQQFGNIPRWICVGIVALPAISTMALLAGMFFAERGVHHNKKRLFRDFGFEPNFDYDRAMVHLKLLPSPSQSSSDK